MCGIVGYAGNKKALNKILTGLKSLEYRGYDSAGIAYIKDDEIKVIKREGPIKNLEENINYDEDTNIGISHTRWATHGEANDINAHPHRQGKITLVHNGIIENYDELKKELLKKGYVFKTGTDTEVAAAVIDDVYNKEKDMIKVLNKITHILKGSYAFNIINDDYKDVIFGIRKDSPLIVGIGDNENVLASDIPAIVHITNKYVVLDNYDVVTVNNSEEHQYLDAYIPSSQIGSKSWSSVVIVKKDKGNGINISTKNISYCTVGMYKNALVTAGIEDADIIVAGPQNISGTAALVGVFKAYQEITGKELPQENVDTALNELVLTGQLESSTGADAESVEGLVAYLKQQMAENGLTDDDSIRKAIDEAADKFDVTMTEDQKAQLLELLKKIGDLDLDVDSLVNQAKSIYDKIENLGADGIFDKIGSFFSNLFSSSADFFKNMYN